MVSEYRDDGELIRFHGRIGGEDKRGARDAHVYSRGDFAAFAKQLSRIEAGERGASFYALSRDSGSAAGQSGPIDESEGKTHLFQGFIKNNPPQMQQFYKMLHKENTIKYFYNFCK